VEKRPKKDQRRFESGTAQNVEIDDEKQRSGAEMPFQMV